MRSLILFLLLLFLFPAPTDPGPQSSAPGPAARGDPAGEELEEFVPSEEIKADSEIAFPVDI